MPPQGQTQGLSYKDQDQDLGGKDQDKDKDNNTVPRYRKFTAGVF